MSATEAHSVDDTALPDARRLVAHRYRVRTVFQPIVDLLTGLSVGFEALSRGEAPLEAADDLFAEARRTGTVWDLEHACRITAIRRVAELREAHGGHLFFLNVSPCVIEDPRFSDEFTPALLRRHGIEPSAIVLEITEKQSITDHESFEGIVHRFSSQGFQLAIDDFGSGHSSLLALATCAPRFIKLDGAIVHNIHHHAYRRHLVRSLNAFTASVDSRLIAEGVESWEEVEELLRLGVRYAQGYLFARPDGDPPTVSEVTLGRLREALSVAEGAFGEADEYIESLVEPVEALSIGSLSVEEVHSAFRERPGLEHLVLVEGGVPAGLITRADLSAKLSGRFAYALRHNKPAERVAKTNALVVSNEARVTTLASHAMERAPADLYDPVIVVDSHGALTGAVTIKSLIQRSIELQVRSAQGANPLSGLPGNRAIQRWIEAARSHTDFAVVYADLDRFKEYNDCYGFLMGDEMIRLAARVLTRLTSNASSARLGHVGGDDFVAVFPEGVDAAALSRACREFDEDKRSLFDAADLEREHLVSENRRGQVEQIPITTLSIAVIEGKKLGEDFHPAVLSHAAASLKAQAKKRTFEERKSAFAVERRNRSSAP